MTERRNRGRRNSNERGSSADRRRRRQWLLSPESGFGGDGGTVKCHAPAGDGICGQLVNMVTMVVGRIKPGYRGGKYTQDNIRPECAPCSCREGQQLTSAARSKT